MQTPITNNNTLYSLLLILLLTISGCKNNRRTSFDLSEMEGLYYAKTPSKTFYIQITQSEFDSSVSYCFINNGNSCDSIAVSFDGNYLVSIENKNKIALFKTKGDDIFVTFPASNRSEKEYPLFKIETPWNNVTIETETPLRYLNPVPNGQVALQEDIIYDNKKGFYSELSTEDVSPADYAGYIEKVAENFENTVLKNGVVPLDLKLDLYYPQNDFVTKRPLIVMAHGGAFLFGNKQNPLMVHFANYFAERGYVVASLNYRLGTTLLGLGALERTVYRAVQDYRNATRFLINKADDYGIDTTSVFYLGHSAGAVAALTAAVMDKDEVYASIDANLFRDDLGEIPVKTKTKGVVALWGGITDLDMIDNTDDLDMLLFHGDEDDIVPCYSGTPFECVTGSTIHRLGSHFATMYGSAAIEERMKQNLLPCKLEIFENRKHDPHLNPDGSFNENLQVIQDITVNYLYEKLKITRPTVIELKTGRNLATYILSHDDIRLIGGIKWEITGGSIVAQPDPNKIKVCWFSNAPNKSLTVKVMTENGIVVKEKQDGF